MTQALPARNDSLLVMADIAGSINDADRDVSDDQNTESTYPSSRATAPNTAPPHDYSNFSSGPSTASTPNNNNPNNNPNNPNNNNQSAPAPGYTNYSTPPPPATTTTPASDYSSYTYTTLHPHSILEPSEPYPPSVPSRR